jgi:signal transduction histidine kinase
MFSDRLSVKYANTLDDGGKAYLTRIQHECRRMQELINDILEFSKISAGTESFEAVNIDSVVREVITELDSQIQEKNARVELDLLPVLQVNPVLMPPLFINLIGNALKYSSKKEQPVIRIHSELTSGNNGFLKKPTRYCRIYVDDNGIGFDQKYAEEIFEMFRRLHPRAEYEGTGIGLALCKKIVEKHAGYISVKSRVDEGSSFIISLPVQS